MLLARDLWGSFSQPEFWLFSAWLDVITKYRRTSLGLLWLVLPTLVFVIVLGNVYSHLMGYELSEYMPYLAVGYITWRFMLQVINDASGAFVTHKAFIMEGRIRLTDFILVSFSKAAFHLFFGALVAGGVMLWSPAIDLSAAWTLLLSLPVLLANLGWVAVCVALVGARFRDTPELIGTVLVVGFLLTPILWMVERFPPDTLRGAFVRVNPAFHLIDVVRTPLLGGAPEPVSIVVVCVMALLGWLFTAWLFRRISRFVPIWV